MGGKKPPVTPDGPMKITPGTYKDVGPKPKGFKESVKWRKEVREERKKLRADMKDYGITDKRTFEDTAYELGLSYGKTRYGGTFGWLFWLLDKLKNTALLKILLAAGALAIGTMFAYSFVAEQAGSFTINLTPNTMQKDFTLSSTADFSKPTSRLVGEKLESISNITFADIAEDVDEIDGSHNGPNYIAFTFYIKNGGDTASSYKYSINVTSASLNVDKAVWVMLFEDGRQSVYAAAPTHDAESTAVEAETDVTGGITAPEDAKCQALFGYKTLPPFYDVAYDQDMYFNEVHNGRTIWGVKTTPFVGDDGKTVVQGILRDVQPEEVHKYTVVIWIEGNDPDCNNEVFGGHAKLSMEFEAINENGGDPFSGLYRVSYEEKQSEVTTAVDFKENQAEIPDNDG